MLLCEKSKVASKNPKAPSYFELWITTKMSFNLDIAWNWHQKDNHEYYIAFI